jgi:hypothetical protein
MSRWKEAETLTEPPSIGLNSSWLDILLSLLESSSLDNLSIRIPDSLSSVEHLDLGRLLCISVEILSYSR